jgi:hypothetical protein
MYTRQSLRKIRWAIHNCFWMLALSNVFLLIIVLILMTRWFK